MTTSSTSPVTVRPATLDDLEFLVDGNLALAVETESLELDRAIVRDGVRALLEGRAPGRYWVAEQYGQCVGQTLTTYEWSDWRNRMVWWIQSVYVVPSARAHGVFSRLYGSIREAAQRDGAGGLRLYVDTSNVRAQKVYAALGMNGEHYRVFEDMF